MLRSLPNRPLFRANQAWSVSLLTVRVVSLNLNRELLPRVQDRLIVSILILVRLISFVIRAVGQRYRNVLIFFATL